MRQCEIVMRRVMRSTWIIQVDNNDWFLVGIQEILGGDGDDIEVYKDGDDDGHKGDWYWWSRNNFLNPGVSTMGRGGGWVCGPHKRGSGGRWGATRGGRDGTGSQRGDLCSPPARHAQGSISAALRRSTRLNWKIHVIHNDHQTLGKCLQRDGVKSGRKREPCSDEHIWGTALPEMGNSFSPEVYRKWQKVKAPITTCGHQGTRLRQFSHLNLLHLTSVKNMIRTEKCPWQLWFCFCLLEMCVALNDHTQKAGLVFFSLIRKGMWAY